MASNVVPFAQRALTRSDARRLALFVKTVGKSLRGDEIDAAIEYAEMYGANPLVGDIHFLVMNAKSEEKRRVVPVISVHMYRKIANRTGNYRPDDNPPRFVYDESLKGPANPRGIVSCEVTVYKHAHNDWHPVTSRLRWEERAPLIESCPDGYRMEDTGERWPDGNPKKKKIPKGPIAVVLDPTKEQWHKMPETLLGKCTEVDAIRKAWPEETSCSYVAEEMDAAHTIELTATEIVEQHQAEQRLSMIGGADAVIIDWCDGKPLDRVPLGQVWDRALAWMNAKDRSSTEIRMWIDRNRHSRAEMKAKRGADYVPWWGEVEKIVNRIERAEHEAEGEPLL